VLLLELRRTSCGAEYSPIDREDSERTVSKKVIHEAFFQMPCLQSLPPLMPLVTLSYTPFW